MAWPTLWVDGEDLSATRLNQFRDALATWGGSVDGGGFNLSNVGTLTFTTLGGNVDVASKNLSNLGLVTFGAGGYFNGNIGLKTVPSYHFHAKDSGFVNFVMESTASNAGAQFNAVTASDGGSGWSFGKRDDLLGGTVAGSFVVAKGPSVYFSINPTGAPRFFAMPTSSAGLPSGALWCDTAAGRVIKQVA